MYHTNCRICGSETEQGFCIAHRSKRLCIWCGCEIPTARLLAVPTTKRCFACQSLCDVEPIQPRPELLVVNARLKMEE